MDIIVKTGGKYKDAIGERVDFKEPYFDRGLRKVFRSAEEKSNYMKAHNITQNGDSDEKAKREKRQSEEKRLDEKRR